MRASRGSGRTAAPGKPEEIACDAIAMSGGWTPSVHLFSQSRGKLVFDEATRTFLPGAPRAGAGQRRRLPRRFRPCRGARGGRAGRGRGRGRRARAAPRVEGAFAAGGGTLGIVAPMDDAELAKAFVDFQNDVTARDIRLATREGMRSIEHIKRYTTTGMATDQGKTSNMNALAIAAEALGKPIAEVGLTTFRLPYTPVTFGVFGGLSRRQMFDPVRETPMHSWYAGKGAVFEEAGLWKRASRVPLPGESKRRDDQARVPDDARQRRASWTPRRSARSRSSGPDAAEFLNRLYINSFAKLGVGRCRYGLMLNEMGFVYDDGVVMRLRRRPLPHHDDDLRRGACLRGDGGLPADRMDGLEGALHLDHRAIRDDRDQRAAGARNPRAAGRGDRSRRSAAFPHMSVREGRICGVPTRLARVSFTGELGFEVNVPSGLWARRARGDLGRRREARRRAPMAWIRC